MAGVYKFPPSRYTQNRATVENIERDLRWRLRLWRLKRLARGALSLHAIVRFVVVFLFVLAALALFR